MLLLEKTAFPREKVCGDGLTPRGTQPLVDMGIDVSEQTAGCTTAACGSSAAGSGCELAWPELASFPHYGLVRPRLDLDEMLARHAREGRRAAARATSRSPAVLDERTGRVVGVDGQGRGQEPGHVPRAARASPPTASPAGSR